MVAAGATILMATSEESSSNGMQNNSARYENHNVSSHYNEIHHNQQNAESPIKRNLTSCTANSKYPEYCKKSFNQACTYQFKCLLMGKQLLKSIGSIKDTCNVLQFDVNIC